MEPRRRRSMDLLIEFSSGFDRNRPRMEKIVSQLDEICKKMTRRKTQLPVKAGVGGVAGLLLAPFTVGLSLLVAGAAAAAAPAAAAAAVHRNKIEEQDTLDEVKELVTEFCDMVQPLKDVQKERRLMLEKLDRKVEEMVLFIDFTSDSTLQRLLEVTQQCRTILQELEKILREKRRLEYALYENLRDLFNSYHSHRDHLLRIIHELKNTESNLQTMEDTERVWATKLSQNLKEQFVLRTEAVLHKADLLKINSEELRALETSSYKKQKWLDLEQSISDLRYKLILLRWSQSSAEFEETLSELDKLCRQMELNA